MRRLGPLYGGAVALVHSTPWRWPDAIADEARSPSWIVVLGAPIGVVAWCVAALGKIGIVALALAAAIIFGIGLDAQRRDGGLSAATVAMAAAIGELAILLTATIS